MFVPQLRTNIHTNMKNAKKTKEKRKKKVFAPALKSEVINQVKADDALIARIIAATNKSYPTVMRWINANSIHLTMDACLSEICKSLKLNKKEVLN